jgi:ABC-type polysaccharide/polyol phosphate export permease
MLENVADMADRDAAAGTNPIGAACADAISGLRAWRLWSKFAWHDMVSRYRRSWVGPFWLVLTTAIFVGAMSLVYSTLFHMAVHEYVPFVAAGIVSWGFIAATATESVSTFVDAETYIRQVRINLFVYVFRVVWRNVLVFVHQFAVVLIVLMLFGKFTLHTLPLAILGIFLFLLQAVWVAPLLGLLGTRFRDLQPIISNVLQVMFFVTPVLWPPSLLGARRWIADYNPLQSLIAILREPLLGSVPSIRDYMYVIVITAAGFLLATLMYGRFRLRVVYWL